MDLEHSTAELSTRGKLSALQRQESCLFNLSIGQRGSSFCRILPFILTFSISLIFSLILTLIFTFSLILSLIFSQFTIISHSVDMYICRPLQQHKSDQSASNKITKIT